MTDKPNLWDTTKKVINFTNPLTGMLIEVVEKSISQSNSVAKNSDIEEMKTEAMRQEITARISEAQAKVAQEIAIANRIDVAEEVTIEEYYDTSGEAGIGLKGSQENTSIGISAGGRTITKRVYAFKGFRSREAEITED